MGRIGKSVLYNILKNGDNLAFVYFFDLRNPIAPHFSVFTGA